MSSLTVLIHRTSARRVGPETPLDAQSPAFRQALDRYRVEQKGLLLEELDAYSARLNRLLSSSTAPLE
jgi:hypothetical protein